MRARNKIIMRKTYLTGIAVLIACLGGSTSGWASEKAVLESGVHVIGVGQTAEFAIKSLTEQSTELHAWCEVSAGGRATLTFDGDHYVPLSEPAVGDTITLNPNEKRRIDLQGTVEANDNNAYIAFIFSGVPSAMCFPGMQCDGATGGARDVRVECGND